MVKGVNLANLLKNLDFHSKKSIFNYNDVINKYKRRLNMSNIEFTEPNPFQDKILTEVNLFFNENISINEKRLKKKLTNILKKYGEKIDNISCKVTNLSLDKYGTRHTFFLDNVSVLTFSIYNDEKIIARKPSPYKYN